MFFLRRILATACTVGVASAAHPLAGSWAFSLPDGNPAWLRVEQVDGGFAGQLLWSVGSAKPVKGLEVNDNSLTFTRPIKWKPSGEPPVMHVQGPITGSLRDDGQLALTVTHATAEGGDKSTFTMQGTKMPPMPPRPGLAGIAFGDPIDLLAEGMEGWRLTNPKKTNGWRVEDGILINETPKTDFGAYGSFGNLRTVRDFGDFRLSIEYNVPKGGNSGIYLRGAYEAQVVDRDSRMQGVQGPGAIFGRIAPSKNAGKEGGQWNRYVLTLVNRHITVELNGEIVIDNQPLVGCTGGGISADDTKAGPIFLQGDHTSVRYRNIVLHPVKGDPRNVTPSRP